MPPTSNITEHDGRDTAESLQSNSSRRCRRHLSDKRTFSEQNNATHRVLFSTERVADSM